MRNRRAIGITTMAILGLLVPATALALGLRAGRTHGVKATARAVPTSSRSNGIPQVGALYRNGGAAVHSCTAGVVASARGNLLITAAHCVSSNADGMVFVPDEHDGRAPYGRWTVTEAHVAPGWAVRQDPDDDVAFLTVAPRTIDGARTEIQQATGALPLGRTARRGERVTVTGYPGGSGSNPITCTAEVYLSDGFPAFDCHGYVGGTSGSPWVLQTADGPRVVGVIGGRNQGGCVESTSYSSPLSRSLATYRRALTEAAADTTPVPHGDGC